MADRLVRVAEGFWRVRGSFRIAGLVDIGTQASLVRCADGRFVWLDSYAYDEDVAKQIDEITEGGQLVKAIVNVHPFHTLHVAEMHRRFPHATLYGTARHAMREPDLPWAPEQTEDQAFHELFRDDFDFSVPRGVLFVSPNENVHFSSVLVYHRASRTIHVDDTLNYNRWPAPLRWVGMKDSLSFHPTLSMALERRPGAAAEFRAWAMELADAWSEAQNLCSAHRHALLAHDEPGTPIRKRILDALSAVSSTLESHERKYGRA